jgi:predicted secreted acid phosphatase
MKLKFILIFAALLLLTNCSLSQNFFFLNDSAAVSAYYTSGSYDAELRGLIAPVIEHFKNSTPNANDVFVFDVDETSLSNFDVFRASHYVFDGASYNKQLEEESSPAVKPVQELYNVLVEKGYKIFFITGRDNNDFNYTHTYGNLKKSGYTKIDSLILRPAEFKTSTAQEYKSTIRQRLASAGYNFVGNAGDQWSDMAGGNAGIMVRVTNYMYCIK